MKQNDDTMKLCRPNRRLLYLLFTTALLVSLYQILSRKRSSTEYPHRPGRVMYIDHHDGINVGHHTVLPILTIATTSTATSVTTRPLHVQNDACYTTTNNADIYTAIECNSTIQSRISTDNFIAIGIAITTRDLAGTDDSSLGQKLPFLRTLLPSLCRTISRGWKYKFYIAFDDGDPLFTRKGGRDVFNATYEDIKKKLCPSWTRISLKMIHCKHAGRPAWAQNDAMMEAYLDNATYFFRVNDDTSISTANWTEKFIKVLSSFDPPNVGVVGPNHRGGNEFILTHDFVHRTHIDIFGFYYPRIFHDWWADDWITHVYQPGRMTKIDDVLAVHTWERGTRYNHSDIESISFLHDRVKQDIVTLKRYINFTRSYKESPDSKKVISMSLYNDDTKYTYGAIANALLRPIIFPNWTMRVYVEKPSREGATVYPQAPSNILAKLKDLGVQLYYVDSTALRVPPMMWRFLVADDQTVEWFIVRDTDSRLSERDATLVKFWMADGAPLHCIRDHPSHVSDPLYGGLWGGRPSDMHSILKTPLTFLMKGFGVDYGQDIYLLSYTVWPHIRDLAYCHDSISCHRYVNSHAINLTRNGYEHVGQVFDAYSEPRKIDIDILQHTNPQDFCIESPREEMPKHRPDDDTNILIEDDLEVSSTKFSNVLIWTINVDRRDILDIKHILEPMGAKFEDLNLNDTPLKGSSTITSVFSKDELLALDDAVIDKFYNFYKNRSEMLNVSHFLCVNPVAMCELYMPFMKAPYNKSIIMVAKDRYESGREDATRWQKLNRNLLRMSWDNHNIVAANNHYDLEYMRYFLGSGMPLRYIPSYCGYVNASYNPRRDGFLIMPVESSAFEEWFVKSLNDSMTKNRIKVHAHKVNSVYSTPSHSDLAAHPGLIHIPEQISLSTICEHYQMNIPIFIPTLGLLSKWQLDWGILKRTLNDKRNSTASPIDGLSKSADPNDVKQEKSLKYWLRFADFYQWPYVLSYDSIDHLIYLMSTTKLHIISRKMKAFNSNLKRQVKEKWIETLEKTMRKNN